MNNETDNTSNLGGDGPSQGDKLASYYHAVQERLWIVLLCLVLGAIGAAIKVAMTVPKFQARSVLFLEQEQNKVLNNVKEVRDEQVGSLDMINTVVDLLGSYTFAERVSKRIEWNDDQHHAIQGPDIPTAGQIPQLVTPRYRKATRLIDIFVTHTNPQVATILANAYAEEYIRYVFEKRSEASKNARRYLIEESERLREKMRVSEEALQNFRQRENSPSPEKQQTLLEGKVQQSTAQIDQLEATRFQLDSDLNVARANVGKIDELLRLPSVAREPKIAQLNQSIADQERVMLLLSQRYRPEHPTYIANQTQLNSLITDRNTTLENVVSLLETGRDHLQAQLDEINKDKKARESDLLAVTGKSVEYNDLKRELDTDRLMYDSVLNRMKEIDMTTGFTSSPVNIQERALGAGSLTESPVKVYITNILLGLAAGVAIALGLNALDTSIRTVESAEEMTGLSVLSAVPIRKKKAGPEASSIFDTVTNRRGLIAEAFRSLRASLAFLSVNEVKRTFMITSAVPSEGKTFCSANFAITLSQQGLKTLLIDADLRKPMVSKVFLNKHVSPGLSDVLANMVPLPEAVIATEVENLTILTAGNHAPNPAELLGTTRFKELLDEALLTYDRIVVDTAPCLAVSDAQLIAPYMEVRCLVIRAMSTPKRTVLRAVKTLDEINCLPDGIILNFLPTRSSYYYSGRYLGSYSGKGVYGAEA
ncbi:MAG: polysaccharide biosynthesis tyrosine autokinase [Chthoniobacterales bacterium]